MGRGASRSWARVPKRPACGCSRGDRRRSSARGPEAPRLGVLARRSVEFLGRVDDGALRDLYRGCRAVIMASVEDFGIVPLEAMACGRPAVAHADAGGRGG